ncbi:MAG: AraC family transcriptional regulator [Archangium sp.]|nr:AraC family transcriptional regulator [Archangium sp.]
MEPTFAAQSLMLVLRPAAAAGIDATALLRRAGLEEPPPERVPFDAVRALWREALLATGDEAFGLTAATAATDDLFDVILVLARASPTMGQAFERVARFARIASEPTRFRLTSDEDGTLTIEHHLEGVIGDAPAAAADAMLGLIVTCTRRFVGPDLQPLSVSFKHPAPRAPEKWRSFFRAPVHFGADRNAVQFAADVTARRLRTSDPTLAAMLERHAESLLAAMPTDASFLTRARRSICEALAAQSATLHDVAKRLQLSSRTLQRRLQDEGTSFDAQLDDIRRQLALQHLAERDTSQAELAFLLGFSDVSAFHRAFRRWTGVAPGAWAKRQH